MSLSFNINSLDPLNISFDDLKHKLIISTSILPHDITEIAFLYRKDYEKANELYEMALNKVDRENEKYINEIKIYMLGLKLQHGIYKEKDFYELNMIDDKRLDLLKGFYFYNKREYEKAYFSFSKVPYLMGMNLASYGLNKFCIEMKENNAKIKCYTDSKYWEDYKENDENKDFLYRIGKSEEYEDENNIDVILTIIENELKNGCSEERMENHIRNLLNLKNTYNNSPEILYLLGKINHIRKNYENAKEYYLEVLKLDSEYTPAVLNLSKITGDIMLKNCKYSVVNDVIALMSVMNKKYDIYVNECSDCIRKTCQLMIKDRTGDLSIINDYEKLIEGKYFENIQDGSDIRIKNGWINKKIDEKLKIDEILFDKEAIYNNLAILQKDKKKGCKLLKDAIEFGSKEYEEYLKYNFGILNRDINILKTLNIKEAKLQICLFNKDSNIDIQELRTYILYEENPEESERLFKQIAEKNDNQKLLYAIIWIGCINIDKYLKYDNNKYLAEASKFFMNNVRSFYCINGLGIIEYYSGRYECAIKYFEQIIDEYNLALYNISCCYINMENYLKGKEIMAEYLKIYNEDTNAKILFEFCNSQIKVNNFNNSLESDLEIEKISSASKNINKNIDKEAERKRKIEDILETRKKLNLN